MKHNAELISDDNGNEILVGYNYDTEPAYYAEKDNPSTFVESTVETELTNVELMVAGKATDVLPLLTKNQIKFIISKLTYND